MKNFTVIIYILFIYSSSRPYVFSSASKPPLPAKEKAPSFRESLQNIKLKRVAQSSDDGQKSEKESDTTHLQGKKIASDSNLNMENQKESSTQGRVGPSSCQNKAKPSGCPRKSYLSELAKFQKKKIQLEKSQLEIKRLNIDIDRVRKERENLKRLLDDIQKRIDDMMEKQTKLEKQLNNISHSRSPSSTTLRDLMSIESTKEKRDVKKSNVEKISFKSFAQLLTEDAKGNKLSNKLLSTSKSTKNSEKELRHSKSLDKLHIKQNGHTSNLASSKKKLGSEPAPQDPSKDQKILNEGLKKLLLRGTDIKEEFSSLHRTICFVEKIQEEKIKINYYLSDTMNQFPDEETKEVIRAIPDSEPIIGDPKEETKNLESICNEIKEAQNFEVGNKDFWIYNPENKKMIIKIGDIEKQRKIYGSCHFKFVPTVYIFLWESNQDENGLRLYFLAVKEKTTENVFKVMDHFSEDAEWRNYRG